MGWEVTEISRSALAMTSPVKSRRSKASNIPSPATMAICSGILSGVAVTSPAEPRKSSSTEAGRATMYPTRRAARTKKRPAAATVSVRPASR